MILSRAGKSSGANKYWFNMKSVDFENINGRENLNEEVLLCKNETFDIVEAKLKELENWKNNKVYSEVANEGQRQISVRRVITGKFIKGVSRTKARLVACGLEEIDGNTIRIDSPTCGRENLRLILLFITLNGWKKITWILSQPFYKENQ